MVPINSWVPMRVYTTAFAWVILIFFNLPCSAQSKFEAGIAVGPSNFLGDLGGHYGRGMTFLKDNNFELTRIMSGGYISYTPNHSFSIRLAVNTGRLEGADSIINPGGGHELTRMERNLHFRSPLREAFLATEIYPLVWMEYDQDDLYRKIRPYVLLGIGIFSFNPQAQYTDAAGVKQWVDLRPLRTEGQGMPKHPNKKEYSLTAVNFPIGFGFKYFVSESFYLGFEVVNRQTTTDYIDDVSTTYIPDTDFYEFFGASSPQANMAISLANQTNLSIRSSTRSGFLGNEMRGQPRNNDAYYSMNLRMGIRLGNLFSKSSYRGSKDKTRCPHFFRW